MRAATISDGSVVAQDHPDPEPAKNEILVRVRSAGLNGADIMQRAGRYPAPPGDPQDIPGLEMAGEVVALGRGVQRFSEGDRVMAVVGGGGQAELCTVHERGAMPVPDNMDWLAAGGFPEGFTTAHDALFTQAELKAGDRLLVHGAAGGVGTAAGQLGSAAGARVTATVRREEARPEVKKLGATVIAPEGFEERGLFDVILELVGAPNLAGNLEALAMQGRIAVIGIAAGAKGEINLAQLLAKRGMLRASMLRARPLEEKAIAQRLVEKHVLPLVEAGKVRVPVAETFPLDDVAAAYERFTEGGK